ncbi:MAG: PAS domain-containing sensor histidine kinase [Bacteroidota bacterium]
MQRLESVGWMMELERNKLDSLAVWVTNHVSAMLAYWDRNLVCRFANAAYLDWFGKSHDEMIDKITLNELLGPLYEKNKPFIQGALEGKVQTFEREIPLPNGTTRFSIANYFPDFVEGEVRGFFVHVADVTPLKQLENELLRSNEIIVEQNKRLLNFTNIISHNLKSYANNLESVLELLRHSESEESRDESLGFLTNISQGFSTTVNHLNEVVKAQNMGVIKPTRINLFDAVEMAIAILRIQLKSNHAVLQNRVGTEAAILANPAYMESILLNLLSNAIKYRHPDRVPLIDISSMKKNGNVILNISDNGLGIDLEKHRKDIFGMYKTFHENKDAQGIGLFITKYHIESMGGTIEVTSVVNKGSTFSIYFKTA